MPNLHEIENAMPVAPLKIAALSSARKMGERVNDYLVEFRKSIHNDKVKTDPAFQGYSEDNYLVEVETPRFGSGEGKAAFLESVRGKDLFLLVDVCNLLSGYFFLLALKLNALAGADEEKYVSRNYV